MKRLWSTPSFANPLRKHLDEIHNSDEIHKKISETQRGQHHNIPTEFKKGHPTWNKGVSGYHFSEDCSQKHRELARKNWDNPKIRKKILLGLQKHQSKGHRYRDTSIEVVIQQCLKYIYFLKFETDYLISNIVRADIVFPKLKIAIFADGCYWHKCLTCGYGSGLPRDARVNSRLLAIGWTPLRFWEHEIRGDLFIVAEEIHSAVAGLVTERNVI